MAQTRGGGSFFGFGAGCVTPGSDSGFWEKSGAAFACSAFGVAGGGAIACGGVVDGMLGDCAGILFCRFRSRGSDASGGRMADSGGRTRGTFTLGMPYQFTVANRPHRKTDRLDHGIQQSLETRHRNLFGSQPSLQFSVRSLGRSFFGYFGFAVAEEMAALDQARNFLRHHILPGCIVVFYPLQNVG